MKVFWTLLAGLVVLTAVLVIAQRGDGDRADDSSVTPTANQPGATNANEQELYSPPEQPAGSSEDRNPAENGAGDSTASTGEDEPDAPDAGEASTTDTVMKPSQPAVEKPDSTTTGGTASKPAEDKPEAPKEAVVRRDDGALVLDGRFVIRGEGTAEKPYIVPWDLLVSAQDTYQPRLGRTDIPERLSMLDGKQVKITGYIAFPLMVSQANELLLMMNQWDGCCVGVPPTPYDGIEVRLSRAVPAASGMNVFHYGSIIGTFKVDPYIVNNWLVGLYMIEEASLEMEM